MSRVPPSLTMMLSIVIHAVHGYPDDPYYATHQRLYLGAMQMEEAWAKAHTAPARTRSVIGVIDSGIMRNHSDLNANVIVGYNVVSNDYDTRDKNGHGTMMAGAAGAVINNEIGIAGIADFVSLMPISVQGTFVGRRMSDYANAVLYAVEEKVDVILLASGWPYDDDKVRSAIAQAAAYDIPIVCPSGNYGKNISIEKNNHYPCGYTETMDGIICVAGTIGDTMRLHEKSNFASFVDTATPIRAFSTNYRGGYEYGTGTSLSAAITAGAAALMKSVSMRHLTAAEVKSIIKETSTPGVQSYDGLTTMKFGRLDASAAVGRVLMQA